MQNVWNVGDTNDIAKHQTPIFESWWIIGVRISSQIFQTITLEYYIKVFGVELIWTLTWSMLSSWFVPPGPVSMRSLTPTASNAQVYWLALEKYQRKCRHCPVFQHAWRCLYRCLICVSFCFIHLSPCGFKLDRSGSFELLYLVWCLISMMLGQA